MSEHRDLIVRRVMTTLEATNDPETLVWSYFEDRDAVIEAALETLEATREDADPAKVAEAVDHELIDSLRLPARSPGMVATLYMRRGWVAAAVAAVGAVGAALLLAL